MMADLEHGPEEGQTRRSVAQVEVLQPAHCQLLGGDQSERAQHLQRLDRLGLDDFPQGVLAQLAEHAAHAGRFEVGRSGTHGEFERRQVVGMTDPFPQLGRARLVVQHRVRGSQEAGANDRDVQIEQPIGSSNAFELLWTGGFDQPALFRRIQFAHGSGVEVVGTRSEPLGHVTDPAVSVLEHVGDGVAPVLEFQFVKGRTGVAP